MKKSILLVLSLILCVNIWAQVNQYGVPYVENYSTQITGGSEQNWCITKDVFGNIWLGNHDRGVIKYDGTNWTVVTVKDNPRMFSIESDDRGVVYVGASYEFGFIQPGPKGEYEYVSISERIDSSMSVQYVYSIIIDENVVNYLSPSYIYQYDVLTDSLSSIPMKQYGVESANRMVEIDGKKLICSADGKLYEFDGTILRRLPANSLVEGGFYTALLPYDDNRILVTPYGDRLFLYNTTTGHVDYSFVSPSLNATFAEEGVYAAVVLDDERYAISTTIGGVYIVDKEGQLLQHVTVENNSLLDNSVSALYCDVDNNGEIWAATYGYVSKISLNIPITKFDVGYNINAIGEFFGDIILSTDGGLVKLNTDNNGEAKFSDIINGTSGQIFPITKFESQEGTFLLAGSIAGVMQIDRNYNVRFLHEHSLGIPESTVADFISRQILPSRLHQDIVYFGTDPGGLLVFQYKNGIWKYKHAYAGISGVASGLIENNDGSLWVFASDPSTILKINNPLEVNTETILYGPDKGLADVRVLGANMIGDELCVFTSEGLLKYDAEQDMFVNGDDLTGGFTRGVYTQTLFEDNDGDIWLSCMKDSYYDALIYKDENNLSVYEDILGILPNAASLSSYASGDRIYRTKTKTVEVIDKSKLQTQEKRPNTFFVSIIIGSDSIMKGQFFREIGENRRVPVLRYPYSSVPEYRYDNNDVLFEWTTPYFTEERRTEYSYILEGYDKAWSAWEGLSFGYSSESIYANYASRLYENLPYGHYTFKVRTRTLTGLESEELSFEFIILKPWYATIVAWFAWFILAGVVISGIIALYTKRLKDENIRLEGIVAERTAVVVKQKEELEASIHYASRIQFALLPSKAILDENIKNNFILFRPRDIVSGDYYWMSKKNNRLYVVAADCTGHGVPGAFMSLLGMSFLEEIVAREVNAKANVVLNQLRQHVTESLKQVGRENEAKDGMDMGLLVFDYENKKVEFSGAYNPCYRIHKMSDEEIESYKENPDDLPHGAISDGKYYMNMLDANKMPIGISLRMDEDFNLYEEDMVPNVSYYMSSDGFIDQFGGDSGKKFMKKNFKKLLLEIQDAPMQQQRDLLEQRLIAWMGPIAQIDDIIVLGVKTE